MFSNATNNYFHLDRHFYSLEFRLFTTFSNKTGRLKEISDGLPICSENVTWVVLKTPVQADAAQFKAMRDIIGGENNRPVQPLNNREVNEDK